MIEEDGHVYRDQPLPEPPEEFLDAYEKMVRELRAGTQPLGVEMMERWNWFENHRHLGGPDLAVMGHQDGDDFKFLIQRDGKTYEWTLRELP